MPILLATTNPGKVREVLPIFRARGIELITLSELPPTDAPEEAGRTYAENARLKALTYAARFDMPTIAEDSGLEIVALDNAPGIHSARFMGADTPYVARFEEIFRRLAMRPDASRHARFVAAVALARGDVILAEAEAYVDGEIAVAPAGHGGFGYDPIFFYPPFGKTTAQCTPDEKEAISHRARACRDVARRILELRAEP